MDDNSLTCLPTTHPAPESRMVKLVRRKGDGRTRNGYSAGAVISRSFQHLLHYVFDLWWMSAQVVCARRVIVLRYADTSSSLQWVDRTFSQSLGEGWKFDWSCIGKNAPDRVRRYANRTGNEEGRQPEDLDFLGFTISAKNGNGLMPCGDDDPKRMRKKLQEIKPATKDAHACPVPQTGAWLRSVVQGISILPCAGNSIASAVPERVPLLGASLKR